MRTYTVHVRPNPVDPDRDLVLVREGFNFWALLFGFLWALVNGLWLVAAGLLALEVVLYLLLPAVVAPAVAVIVQIAAAVLVGLSGNDLRRWTLARRGFVLEGVVGAADALAAEQRFLDHTPDLAAVLRP